MRWVQRLSGASAATLWLVALSLALHPEQPTDFMHDGMTADHAFPLYDPWASDIMCAWGPFETDVNLTVTGATDVFPLGGPVELVGRLTNQVRRVMYSESASQWANWEVRAAYDGDTAELPYLPRILLRRHYPNRNWSRTRYRMAKLGMGKSWDDPLDLSTWFDLGRPGKYRVVVARFIWYEGEALEEREHWVRSNVLEFEIRAGPIVVPEWPR